MAHPAGSELRSRTVATPQRVHKFSDQALLLDEEAVLSKHQMMEGQAVEIELLKEQEEQRGSERLYFRDGKRLIDFVLAFETPADADDQKEEEKEKQRELAEKRKVFEENLQTSGLELEHEDEISTKVSLESTLFAFYNRMPKIVGKILKCTCFIVFRLEDVFYLSDKHLDLSFLSIAKHAPISRTIFVFLTPRNKIFGHEVFGGHLSCCCHLRFIVL